MKTLKSSKSKGFTLIELLVVIAIITLLSSVVLASLKGAREKAILTKTVSEMKSLQTALELYKNDKGVYPGEGSEMFKDQDYEDALIGGNGLNEFIQTNLVDNKYIPVVPKSPNYPNNCKNGTCLDNGYVLGYSTYVGDNDYYYVCGSERVKKYFIFLYSNTKKLNLPKLVYVENGINTGLNPFSGTNTHDTYCIAG